MKNDKIWKQIIENAFKFIINVGFVMIFQMLFGAVNVLPAVAIGVGFTMLPVCDLGIRPAPMFLITFVLYTGAGILAQSAMISPWIAFPLNFMFVLLILLLSNEPENLKSNISFLLCFVFAQAVPVPWDQFPSRFLCTSLGGLLVGTCIFISWHQKGYGKDGCTLKEQIQRCKVHRSYLFRMSFGIALAMFIGSIFHLKKPLWISIVVMSLTQLEFAETLERIKHRFIGTLLGIVLFFIFFQLLIPQKYAMLVVMFLGYIGFFFPAYKYKQIINAISALNASLVILDTKTAFENRLLCLVAGISIVVFIYFLTKLSVHTHRLKKHIDTRVQADDFIHYQAGS